MRQRQRASRRAGPGRSTGRGRQSTSLPSLWGCDVSSGERRQSDDVRERMAGDAKAVAARPRVRMARVNIFGMSSAESEGALKRLRREETETSETGNGGRVWRVYIRCEWSRRVFEGYPRNIGRASDRRGGGHRRTPSTVNPCLLPGVTVREAPALGAKSRGRLESSGSPSHALQPHG